MLKALKNDISLSVFQNQNNISYNLFNKIYKTLKTDFQYDSTTIKNFEKFGFSKSITIPESEINLINDKINLSKKRYFKNVTNYEFDNDLVTKTGIFDDNYIPKEIKTIVNPDGSISTPPLTSPRQNRINQFFLQANDIHDKQNIAFGKTMTSEIARGNIRTLHLEKL